MKNDLTLLPIRNAQVSYAESIPFVRSAEVLLQELIAQIEWEHKDVVIQGRSYKQPRLTAWQDRKRVVKGKSVSVSVDIGGRRIIKTKRSTVVNNTNVTRRDNTININLHIT